MKKRELRSATQALLLLAEQDTAQQIVLQRRLHECRRPLMPTARNSTGSWHRWMRIPPSNIGNPGWFDGELGSSHRLKARQHGAGTDHHEADDVLEHFGQPADRWTVLTNAMRRSWLASMTRCTERKLMPATFANLCPVQPGRLPSFYRYRTPLDRVERFQSFYIPVPLSWI